MRTNAHPHSANAPAGGETGPRGGRAHGRHTTAEAPPQGPEAQSRGDVTVRLKPAENASAATLCAPAAVTLTPGSRGARVSVSLGAAGTSQLSWPARQRSQGSPATHWGSFQAWGWAGAAHILWV